MFRTSVTFITLEMSGAMRGLERGRGIVVDAYSHAVDVGAQDHLHGDLQGTHCAGGVEQVAHIALGLVCGVVVVVVGGRVLVGESFFVLEVVVISIPPRLECTSMCTMLYCLRPTCG
jgi:hypothetical protein